MKQQSNNNEVIFAVMIVSIIASVFLVLNSIYFVHVLNYSELQISAAGATVLYLVMKYIAPALMILVFIVSTYREVKGWYIK